MFPLDIHSEERLLDQKIVQLKKMLKFIYFEREGMCKRGRREGEREISTQAPHCQHEEPDVGLELTNP